jgi:GGDEF domain-containing protein
VQKLAVVIRINHRAELRNTLGPEQILAIHRQFAEVVRLACRSSDMVLRRSADELGAILWVSDADDGTLLAERIQDRVRRKVFRTGDGSEVRLTCSIGFCAHPVQDQGTNLRAWERTVELADLAVDAAMDSSDDSWVGFLGSDRPPPSATVGGRRQPSGLAEHPSRPRPLRVIIADRRQRTTTRRVDEVH